MLRSAMASHPSGPVSPIYMGVRLKSLPFLDTLCELIRPSLLQPRAEGLQAHRFMFLLTPEQATTVATNRERRPNGEMEHKIQVQVRFCLFNTSYEQRDCYPPGAIIIVNGAACRLPTNRPPLPLDITDFVRLSPTVANCVTVQWNVENETNYCMGIALVRKLSPYDLLHKLKMQAVKHADFTRGLIKAELQKNESGITFAAMGLLLKCPISKIRITTPCRSTTCNHFDCFDALSYFQMNEKKPTWMCPVCNKPAKFENLFIDGYFQEIVSSGKLGESTAILLHRDGSWSSPASIKNPQKVPVPFRQFECNDIVVPEQTKGQQLEMQSVQQKNKQNFIDLTLSDSDDASDSEKKQI